MTQKQLLDAFHGVSDHFILEALDTRATRSRVSRSRLVLIAAVIALAALLMGCMAALLRLQDMSLGKEGYTQIFDDQGHYIDPTERTKDIIGAFVSRDSPMGKALRELYDFDQRYDPEGALIPPNGQEYSFNETFAVNYGCYTQEMADKVQEIATEYGLKLLEPHLIVQRYQWEAAHEALGFDSFLRDGAQAETYDFSGLLMPPQNFSANFTMQLTGENAAWTEEFLVEYEYLRKDYLPSYGFWGLDLDNFQQWDYTAPDGSRLMLALNKTGLGFIVAEQEEAVVQITITCLTDTNFPEPGGVITQKGLEQVADCFQYRLEPAVMDSAVIGPKLDAAEEAYHQELVARNPKSNSFAQELLGMAYQRLDWFFTFYDLDGDGSEELLLGSTGTGFMQAYLLHDGEVEDLMWIADVRLLENGGVLVREYPGAQEEDYRSYVFYAPTADGAAMKIDFTEHYREAKMGNMLVKLTCRDGIWTQYSAEASQDGTVITEAQAQAIIDQYPEKALPWASLRAYPMDEAGTSLGDYMAQIDVRLDEAALLRAYAEQAATLKNITHYALRDINGDGVQDLLVSSDGDLVWCSYTHRYGRIMPLSQLSTMGFYVCQGNVIERVQTVRQFDGAEQEITHYYRLSDFKTHLLEGIAWNKATSSWLDPATGAPISDAEATAIRSKYPRITLDWKPISELTG